MSSHFGAELIGVYGGFVAVHEVFGEGVFYVGRTVSGLVKTGVVGFVFGEEKFWLAGSEEPAFAIPPVLQLGGEFLAAPGRRVAAGTGLDEPPGGRATRQHGHV